MNRFVICIQLVLLGIFSALTVQAQITPPAGISESSMVMWLSPDTAVYENNGTTPEEGDNVTEWHDISGNGWVFRNTRNNRTPNFTTIGDKNYLDFSPGDFLFNTSIADSINGLEEFSIFVVVKSDETNTDKGLLYWKYPPDGEDDGLCLRYDASGWWTGRTNLIKAGFQGNAGNNQIETTGNTQTTDRQVLTLTWKRGQRIKSYIDGVENDSSDVPLDNALSGIQEILIGKGAKDENNNEGWNGKIGTFIFYGKEFNQDTVEDISNDLDIIKSVQSGDWNDPDTWDCDCSPHGTQKVKIVEDHIITLTQNETIGNIHIVPSATLDLGGNKLEVSLNFINLGTVNAANSTISMTGTSGQRFGSNRKNVFHNIEVDNSGSGVQFYYDTINLSGDLTILDGNIKISSHLLLLSTESNTARIGRIRPGSAFEGRVTVQRYIYNANRIWRYLSSPIADATVSDWQDDTPITGTFDNPSKGPGISSSSPSLYYYNEQQEGSLNSGWTNYPASGSSTEARLEIGKGYSVYVRNNVDRPETLEVTGRINQGTINVDLDYTNTGNLLSDGWNLVGNPYPSQIDWDNINETRRPGVDNAIYYTDNLLGVPVYRSYVAGIGVPSSTTGVIGSSQGFWVHTNSANPYIRFRESDKTGKDHSFYKTSPTTNLLRLSVKNEAGNRSDEAAIHINPLASTNFDPQFDALKFGSANISVRTKFADHNYSINSFGIPTHSEEIVQVQIQDVNEGTHQLELKGLQSYEAGYEIFLIDSLLDTVFVVENDLQLQFEVTDDPKTYYERFKLLFVNKKKVTATNNESEVTNVNVFPNPNSTGMLNFEMSYLGHEELDISLYDGLGRQIKQFDINDITQYGHYMRGELNIQGFSPGCYFLNVIFGNERKVIRVIIQ